MKRKVRPCALTIAGSDSGGGAGIQADLKTFAALGVHGTSAVTCITAQNPREVTGIEAISPAMVRKQIDAVTSAFPVSAVKTGMLFSKTIIEQIAEVLGNLSVPIILDPVMISTSGKELLQPSAKKALQTLLFPLAALITPNLDEAQALVGEKISEPEDLRATAKRLYETYGCPVLAKGGHMRGLNTAVDFYYNGQEELLLEAEYIRGVSTHGTGCTYAAAIAAFVARGCALTTAIPSAKNFISNAIAQSYECGEFHVLEQMTH